MDVASFARGYALLLMGVLLVVLFARHALRLDKEAALCALAWTSVSLSALGLLLSTALGAMFTGPSALIMAAIAWKSTANSNPRNVSKVVIAVCLACSALIISAIILIFDLRHIPLGISN